MKLRALLFAVLVAVTACSKTSPQTSSAPTPFAVPAPATAPTGFDSADARAFYEALVFSLQQAGRPDVAGQLSERDVTTAVTRAYPSASPEIRAALDNASQTWAQVQASWSGMSLEDRREFVYAVLAIGIGEQAANQLAGQAAPKQRGGNATSSGSPDVVVDYEGSGCWASAGCSGYESSGGGGSYSFDE